MTLQSPSSAQGHASFAPSLMVSVPPSSFSEAWRQLAFEIRELAQLETTLPSPLPRSESTTSPTAAAAARLRNNYAAAAAASSSRLATTNATTPVWSPEDIRQRLVPLLEQCERLLSLPQWVSEPVSPMPSAVGCPQHEATATAAASYDMQEQCPWNSINHKPFVMAMQLPHAVLGLSAVVRLQPTNRSSSRFFCPSAHYGWVAVDRYGKCTLLSLLTDPAPPQGAASATVKEDHTTGRRGDRVTLVGHFSVTRTPPEEVGIPLGATAPPPIEQQHSSSSISKAKSNKNGKTFFNLGKEGNDPILLSPVVTALNSVCVVRGSNRQNEARRWIVTLTGNTSGDVLLTVVTVGPSSQHCEPATDPRYQFSPVDGKEGIADGVAHEEEEDEDALRFSSSSTSCPRPTCAADDPADGSMMVGTSSSTDSSSSSFSSSGSHTDRSCRTSDLVASSTPTSEMMMEDGSEEGGTKEDDGEKRYNSSKLGAQLQTTLPNPLSPASCGDEEERSFSLDVSPPVTSRQPPPRVRDADEDALLFSSLTPTHAAASQGRPLPATTSCCGPDRDEHPHRILSSETTLLMQLPFIAPCCTDHKKKQKSSDWGSATTTTTPKHGVPDMLKPKKPSRSTSTGKHDVRDQCSAIAICPDSLCQGGEDGSQLLLVVLGTAFGGTLSALSLCCAPPRGWRSAAASGGSYRLTLAARSSALSAEQDGIVSLSPICSTKDPLARDHSSLEMRLLVGRRSGARELWTCALSSPAGASLAPFGCSLRCEWRWEASHLTKLLQSIAASATAPLLSPGAGAATPVHHLHADPLSSSSTVVGPTRERTSSVRAKVARGLSSLLTGSFGGSSSSSTKRKGDVAPLPKEGGTREGTAFQSMLTTPTTTPITTTMGVPLRESRSSEEGMTGADAADVGSRVTFDGGSAAAATVTIPITKTKKKKQSLLTTIGNSLKSRTHGSSGGSSNHTTTATQNDGYQMVILEPLNIALILTSSSSSGSATSITTPLPQLSFVDLRIQVSQPKADESISTMDEGTITAVPSLLPISLSKGGSPDQEPQSSLAVAVGLTMLFPLDWGVESPLRSVLDPLPSVRASAAALDSEGRSDRRRRSSRDGTVDRGTATGTVPALQEHQWSVVMVGVTVTRNNNTHSAFTTTTPTEGTRVRVALIPPVTTSNIKNINNSNNKVFLVDLSVGVATFPFGRLLVRLRPIVGLGRGLLSYPQDRLFDLPARLQQLLPVGTPNGPPQRVGALEFREGRGEGVTQPEGVVAALKSERGRSSNLTTSMKRGATRLLHQLKEHMPHMTLPVRSGKGRAKRERNKAAAALLQECCERERGLARSVCISAAWEGEQERTAEEEEEVCGPVAETHVVLWSVSQQLLDEGPFLWIRKTAL